VPTSCCARFALKLQNPKSYWLGLTVQRQSALNFQPTG
jgi:hypothetical protein